MNKILAIRLYNQLFFWQNWIVFLKWWTFVRDLSCTEMIFSDRKILELHCILFFSNLNPDLAWMYNFHVSCILLTALFRYFFDCRWSLPLFNSRCIKSSISTTIRAENVWANLNNLRCVPPCNHSICKLPFELQRIIKYCKIRLHIKLSFLAVNLRYFF